MRRRRNRGVYQRSHYTIRFGFAELESFLTYQRGADDALLSYQSVGSARTQSDGRISAMIGVHRSIVQRWRTAGTINVETAGRIADTLGVHGWEIWPNYYDDIDIDKVKELA